jgi:hypothetical protein
MPVKQDQAPPICDISSKREVTTSSTEKEKMRQRSVLEHFPEKWTPVSVGNATTIESASVHDPCNF